MEAVGGSKFFLLDWVFLAFIFWFGSRTHSYVLISGGPAPVLSYLALVGVFSIYVMVQLPQQGFLLVTKGHPHFWVFLLWLLTYVVWTAMAYLYSSQSDVATQLLISRYEAAFLGLIFCYFMLSRHIHSRIAMILVLIAVLGTVLNIWDFINPTFSKVPGRSAGFYENPNISGLILTMTMTAAIAHIPRSLRWPFLLFVSLGIFLTFSRGAWLILFLTVIWLTWAGYLGGKYLRPIFGLAALFVVGLLSYFILMGALGEFIAATPLAHYLTPNTLARLGIGGFITDASALEREAVLQFGLQQFADSANPLFGRGLGYTLEWAMRVGTHNMYVMFLVEGGVLGFALYGALILILWRAGTGVGKLLALQFVVAGVFTHNLLDDPGNTLFLALVFSGAINTIVRKPLFLRRSYIRL